MERRCRWSISDKMFQKQLDIRLELRVEIVKVRWRLSSHQLDIGIWMFGTWTLLKQSHFPGFSSRCFQGLSAEVGGRAGGGRQ